MTEDHDGSSRGDGERVCACCGLPPEPPRSLVRCSRCRSAWYHGIECQRKHFKEHKEFCRSVATGGASGGDGGGGGGTGAGAGSGGRKTVVGGGIVVVGNSRGNSGGMRPAYRVETREGRGRCLVATRTLSRGTRLSSDLNRDVDDSKAAAAPSQSFGPLVPPVLTTSHRRTRCSRCFAALSAGGGLVIDGPPPGMRPLVHMYCSARCKSESISDDADEERTAFELARRAAAAEGGSEGRRTSAAARVGPTCLLLYRLVRAMVRESESAKRRGIDRDGGGAGAGSTAAIVGPARSGCGTTAAERLSELQSHRDAPSLSDDESDFLRSVAGMTLRLVSCSAWFQALSGDVRKEALSSLLALDSLADTASKIVTNGFSICDGEGLALGLGLYPTASAVNHACRPNVVQTFRYGSTTGRSPSLFLTVCRPIQAGEELCIGYVDVTAPTPVRREALLDGYKFECRCKRCQDEEENAATAGVRCPRDGCDGVGRSGSVEGGDNNPSAESVDMVCSACGQGGFGRCVRRRDEAFGIVGRFAGHRKRGASCAALEERRLSVSSQGNNGTDELVSAYATLKGCCTMSSWYVQEAGEALVQSILDSLGSADSEHKMREMCSHALFTLEEMGKALGGKCAKRRAEYCPLPPLLRQYKAAKLQLYLHHDPRPALLVLQTVHRELLTFYPKDHELIQGLEECMSGAMS